MKKISYFLLLLFSSDFVVASHSNGAYEIDLAFTEFPLFVDGALFSKRNYCLVSPKTFATIKEKAIAGAPYALIVSGYLVYYYYISSECNNDDESGTCDESKLPSLIGAGHSLLELMGGSYLMANIFTSKIQSLVSKIEMKLPIFFQSQDIEKARKYMKDINNKYETKKLSLNNKEQADKAYESFMYHYNASHTASEIHLFFLKRISLLATEVKIIRYSDIQDGLDKLLDTYSDNLHKQIKKFTESICLAALKHFPTKTIICFQGEPGTGKTRLAQELAKLLGLSLITFEASAKNAVRNIAQYIAQKDEEIMLDLYTKEKNNYKNNILFIDEFDRCLRNEKTKDAFRNFFLNILEKNQRIYESAKIRGLEIDISALIVILACNELPQDNAILDRITVVNFSDISKENQLKIATNTFYESIANFRKEIPVPENFESILKKIVKENKCVGVRALKEVVDMYVSYIAKSFFIIPNEEEFNVQEAYHTLKNK